MQGLLTWTTGPLMAAAAAPNNWPFQWTLIVLGIIGLGIFGFLAYRWIDFLQLRHIPDQPLPEDPEHLTPEIYEMKRKRKHSRMWKHIFKGSGSWLTQALYIIPGMALAVHGLRSFGIKDGTIYTVLMVATFFFNMLLSKLFSIWNPSLPC